MLTMLLIAITVSMDAFVVGLSYGMQKIGIPVSSKIVVGLCTFVYTSLAILLGKILIMVLSPYIEKIIGASILIAIGLYGIFKNIRNDSTKVEVKKEIPKDKELKIHVKFLKMTIQIIKHAELGDYDNSRTIDAIEALYIGLALSLDGGSAGLASCMTGFNTTFLPFIFAVVQITLFSIGISLGRKVSYLTDKYRKLLLVMAGLVLVCLGITRMF